MKATERILVSWREAGVAAAWPQVFGRTGDVHLEVGFGDGRYTVRRALDEPGGLYVGVEVSGVSVRRAIKNVRRSGVRNVRIMKGTAQAAARQAFTAGSLASVTVNFPDPWPKDRHESRRLLQGPFLDVLADRLKLGGEVRLATDHEDYFHFSVAQLDAHPAFVRVPRMPPDAVFQTKYALKWREQSKPVHYGVYRRVPANVTTQPPIERPNPMPHALLTGPQPHFGTLEKTVIERGDAHVILHEAAAVLTGDGQPTRVFVRTTVDEPEFTQQLLVAVQKREGDEWIVRVESFGDPIITDAVRGAVHGVTEWLAAQDGWQVTARNY